MKAVILAGGKGTRVRPLTYLLPKPMVPIVERPIMSFLLDLLKKHNFNEVVVTVGYLATMIEDKYKNGADNEMFISYSLEGKMVENEIVPSGLGSAGGLAKVQNFSKFFDDDFLVICGDAIIDLDLSEVMKYHKAKNSTATVILKEVAKEEVYKYGVVVTDENDSVLSFQEKPKVEEAKSNMINTGIYIFSPKVFDYIPNDEEFDIGKDLLPLLVEKSEPFFAKSFDFQWIDVGSTKDFYNANMMVIDKKVNGVTPFGKEIKESVWVGINSNIDESVEIAPPVYIGGGVKIEKGVKIIGPAMIGANSIIKEDTTIDKSIILNYTKINSFANIKEKIIAGKYLINPLGASIDIEETDMNFLVDDARRDEKDLNEEQKEIMQMLKDIENFAINK